MKRNGLKNKKELKLPATVTIQEAYRDIRYRQRFWDSIRSTIFMLIVVSAIAVLVAVLFLPILRIYGHSMKGTLDNGDFVVSVKSTQLETGDVVAFYYNNNILVKRVIASSGQWVDMDDQGNVYVDDKLLEEPYLDSKDYGQVNIDFPYQVPDGRYFVIGDNRAVSIDSRNSAVGTISEEQLVGELILKIWPLSEIGLIE